MTSLTDISLIKGPIIFVPLHVYIRVRRYLNLLQVKMERAACMVVNTINCLTLQLYSGNSDKVAERVEIANVLKQLYSLTCNSKNGTAAIHTTGG